MLFAAYFLKLGFGVASFFVTMMLVMLYELLGRFTDQVLLVRVLEILAGAACGGLAATVLLPTSTKMIFRADARAALQALRDALDVMASADAVEAQSAVRRCDAAVRRLRTRVDPLHSGPTFAGASLFARRWLRDVELCAYYARNAVCAPRDGADLALRAHEANVEADAILGAIDADESWPRPSSPAPAPEIPQFAQGPAEAFSDRIRVMLQRLRGTFTQPPAL